MNTDIQHITFIVQGYSVTNKPHVSAQNDNHHALYKNVKVQIASVYIFLYEARQWPFWVETCS
jgi:hypothetical protein